jgi:hypothetical protein
MPPNSARANIELVTHKNQVNTRFSASLSTGYDQVTAGLSGAKQRPLFAKIVLARSGGGNRTRIRQYAAVLHPTPLTPCNRHDGGVAMPQL